MPLRFFKCPDGEKIEVKECMKSCRMKVRCASKNYLTMAGKDRPWDGKGSITMYASNGPRATYLKIKHDYAVDPLSKTFAVLGTSVDAKLDGYTHDGMIDKRRIHDDFKSGEFDVIEIENGVTTLIDRKVWGAYKIQKALNGDVLEEEYQLNGYRMLLEREGFHIDEMILECIAREPEWYQRKNGVPRNLVRIPVRRMDDAGVQGFFEEAHRELKHHLETNTTPRLCNEREAWGGNRCKKYCEVKEHCMKCGDNTYLAG